jgi:hypothetical protein
MTHPLRLLATAYAGAVAVGGLLFALGAGVTAAALAVWIGGALAALVLPLLPVIGRAFRWSEAELAARDAAAPGQDAGQDAGREASLAAWDAERAAASLPADGPRRSGAST